MQVHREAEKIKGEAIPGPPDPEAAAVSALLSLSTTANVGRVALVAITPVRVAGPILLAAGVAPLPLPPRKTQKNVASGADRAAERVEAQGRPGTGKCASYYWQLPTAATAEECKNLWFEFLMHICDTCGRFGCDKEWVWPCTIGCSAGHSPTYPRVPRGSHHRDHSREEVLCDGGQAHHIGQHVQVCQDCESKCGGGGEGEGQEAAFGVSCKA